NMGATKESGEPNHAGNSGGKSVWWTWMAPASGQVTIDTQGSTFDTLLAVYTGASVDHLSGLVSNDDSGGGTTSQVTFAAQAGTAYHIAVDGYNGSSGNIVLHWNLTVPRYTLTVTLAGNGSGSVTSNPAGITCGTDCTEIYNSGTVVTFTATPASG